MVPEGVVTETVAKLGTDGSPHRAMTEVLEMLEVHSNEEPVGGAASSLIKRGGV